MQVIKYYQSKNRPLREIRLYLLADHDHPQGQTNPGICEKYLIIIIPILVVFYFAL